MIRSIDAQEMDAMSRDKHELSRKRTSSTGRIYLVRCDVLGGNSFTTYIDALSRADAITQVKWEYDNITDVSIIRV